MPEGSPSLLRRGIVQWQCGDTSGRKYKQSGPGPCSKRAQTGLTHICCGAFSCQAWSRLFTAVTPSEGFYRAGDRLKTGQNTIRIEEVSFKCRKKCKTEKQSEYHCENPNLSSSPTPHALLLWKQESKRFEGTTSCITLQPKKHLTVKLYTEQAH